MTPDPRFPPGALPEGPGRLFLMAYEIAFRRSYAGEPQVEEEGRTTTTAVRKLGKFDFRIELHVIVPKLGATGPSMNRFWAWIWYEDALVFDAWCSKATDGSQLGLVQKCDEGPWRYHLRLAHEKDERI